MTVETYVFFGCGALIPLSFLAVALLRLCSHYRDGRQNHKTKRPRLHYCRRICTLVLAGASLFSAVDEATSQVDLEEGTLKTAFFAIFACAWVTSFVLLRFEYERGIGIAWAGQKGLWVSSAAVFLCAAVLSSLAAWDDSEEHEMMWARISVWIFSSGVSLVLGVIGLVKPDDFAASGQWTEALTSSVLSPLQTSGMEYSGEIAGVSIQMENFKKKVVDGRSVDFYELIVSVKDVGKVVWKSYADFDAFHRSITEKYEGEFPNLTIPPLPEISNIANIDTRLDSLKRFLDELCFPAFYCEEFLDFLQLQGDSREFLLKEHFKVTGTVRGGFNVSASRSGSVLILDRRAGEKGRFFEALIVDWRQAEGSDTHIEYDIQWKFNCELMPELQGSSREGRIVRRFNDFYLLHKYLKQELSPARLPDFPNKTYLSRLIHGVDKEAVEYRRRALEHYLQASLNDPAYLSPRLLDFIGCTGVSHLDVFAAYRPTRTEVRLAAPLQWEYELGDNNEHYILYLLLLEKAGKRWTTKRRFREFDAVHRRVVNRIGSPLLTEFLEMKKAQDIQMRLDDFPQFPKKILQLSSREEIENRRKALENYLLAVLQTPFILEAFAFRQFIDDQSD